MKPVELERRLREAGRWPELAELYEKMSARAPEPSRGAMLLQQAAKLFEQKVKDPERAEKCRLKALELDPSCADAFRALAARYEQREEFRKLADLVSMQAAASVEPIVKSEHFLELARIEEEKLARHFRALVEYKRAFMAYPANIDALNAAKSLASKLGLNRFIIALLEEQLKLDIERKEASRELLELASDLEESDPLSFDLVTRCRELALEADPDGIEARQALEEQHKRALKAGKTWRKTFKKELGEAKKSPPQKARRLAYDALGLALAAGGEGRDEAMNAAREILHRSPGDEVALETAKRLMPRQEYVALLWDQFGATKRKSRKLELCYELLPLVRSLDKDDTARYEELLKRGLDIDRTAGPCRRLMRELLEEKGDYQSMASLLEEELDNTDEPLKKVPVLRDLARLYASKVGDRAAAARHWERLLEIVPDDEEASNELIELRRALGDKEGLARALDMVAGRMEPGEDRSSLLKESASIKEELDDPDLAFAAWCRAFREDPTDVQAIEGMERSAEAAGAWEELASVYQEELNRVAVAQSTAFALRAGDLWREKCGDPAAAMACYRHVLLSDPGKFSSARLKACRALAEIHYERGEPGPAAEAMEKALDIPAGEQGLTLALKKDILVQIGRYKREAGDLAGADAALRTALEIDGRDKDALLELAYTLEQVEDLAGLSGILEKLVNVTDGEDKAAALCMSAMVKAERTGDISGAFEELARAMEISSSGEKVIETLEKMRAKGGVVGNRASKMLADGYEAAGEWRKLSDLLEEELGRAEGVESRLPLLARIGNLQENRLGQPDMAFVTWCRALREAPDRQEPYDALFRLADTVEEGWNEVAALCEEIADTVKEARPAAFAALKAAEVYELRLGMLQEAKDLYKKAFKLAGGIEDDLAENALDAMERIAIESEDARDLIRVIAFRIEFGVGVHGDKEKALLLKRLGALKAERLGDSEGAVGPLEEAVALNPDDKEAVALLASLLENTGAFDRLAELLEESFRREENSAAKRATGLRLASILSTRLDRRKQAAEVLAGLLADDASDQEVIAGLEEMMEDAGAKLTAARALAPIYRDNEQWAKLAEAIEVMLDAEDADKVSLFPDLITVYQDKLARPDLAFLTACRWHADIPGDEEAKKMLESLAAETGSWDEAVRALEQEIENAADPVSAARTRIRVASLHLERLDRPDRAIDHLKAVMDDPSKGVAPMKARAADILAELYESQGAWSDLAEVLEAKLEWLERRNDKADVLRNLAGIYKTKLDDIERAFGAVCRGLRQVPTSKDALADAEEMAAQGGFFEKLAALYEDLAEEMVQEMPSLAASYYHRLGKLLETKLNKKEKARAAYRDALAARPEDLESLRSLQNLAERVGDFEEVADLLRREAAILEEDAAIHVRLKLAGLLYNELGDLEGAYEQYKHVVRSDPKCMEALSALEDLLEKRGAQASARLGVMQLMLRATPRNEQAPLLKRMARLALNELDRPNDSIKYLKRAREISPDDGEIQEMLIAAYETTGDSKALVKLYGKQAVSSVGEERVRWLRKAAALLESGEGLDRESAKRAWEAVLSAEPEDPAALNAMLKYHREDGQWEKVADVLRRLIPLQHDPAEARRLFLELAAVSAEKLGDLGNAVESATKALELEPLDLGDLEKAEKVFVHCSAWPEYVALLSRRAELVEDPARAAEVHKTRAKLLLNRLHNPAEAAEAYRRALELVPGDVEAKKAVRDLYETTGGWDQLAEMIQSELNSRPNRKKRNELLRELCEIYENRLDSREQALRAYFRAFREDPSDEEVQDGLERIARDAGKLEAMVQIYKDTAEALGDRSLAAKMFMKVAAILENDLERYDEAADSYRMVLALEPSNANARESLVRLLSKQGRFDELAGTLRAQAESERAKEEKVELLVKAARVYEEKLSDLKEASSCLALAVDADPKNHEILEEAVRVLGEQEQWDEAVSILEKAAAAETDPKLAKVLKLRIADLLDKKIGDFEGAIAIYRSYLKESPSDEVVLDALSKIYTKTGMWEDLLEVFARRAGATQDAKKRAALYRQMASIADEEFGDASRAARHLKRALELEPEDTSTLASLEAALRRAEEWEELVDVLKKRRELEDESSAAAALCFERGNVLQNRLFEIDDAVDCYREALELDPGFTPAAAALADIFQSMKDWQACLDVLKLQAEHTVEEDESSELYLRMGRIYQEHLEDKEKAREWYQKALELDPSNPEAVTALKGLSADISDWPAYLSLLAREADLTADPEKKAALFVEMGDIYLHQLNDPDEAGGYYESALASVPGYPAAALPLGNIAFSRKDWEKAEEYLSSVMARSYRAGEETATNELVFRLGFAAEMLGKDNVAFQRYKEAYELDAVHLPTLEGLARLAEKRGESDLALKVLKTILFHHRNQKRPEEILDIYCKLGELHFERGEHDQASRMFEKALVVDGSCVAALERMSQLLDEKGDKARAQAFRLRLRAAKKRMEDQGGSK